MTVKNIMRVTLKIVAGTDVHEFSYSLYHTEKCLRVNKNMLCNVHNVLLFFIYTFIIILCVHLYHNIKYIGKYSISLVHEVVQVWYKIVFRNPTLYQKTTNSGTNVHDFSRGFRFFTVC